MYAVIHMLIKYLSGKDHHDADACACNSTDSKAWVSVGYDYIGYMLYQWSSSVGMNTLLSTHARRE